MRHGPSESLIGVNGGDCVRDLLILRKDDETAMPYDAVWTGQDKEEVGLQWPSLGHRGQQRGGMSLGHGRRS